MRLYVLEADTSVENIYVEYVLEADTSVENIYNKTENCSIS